MEGLEKLVDGWVVFAKIKDWLGQSIVRFNCHRDCGTYMFLQDIYVLIYTSQFKSGI